jgi:diguanylate cyclase (GGDEF)-like protein
MPIPVFDASTEAHEAPTGNFDFSMIGSVVVLVSFDMVNGTCCLLTRAPVFFGLLAANMLLSGLRLTFLLLAMHEGASKKRWRIESYVIITIIWCALESLMVGRTVLYGMNAMALIGMALTIAPQGFLATRTLPGPRFVGAIILSLGVPYSMWTFLCPNHSWLALAVFSPGYSYAMVLTAERLLNLIMAKYMTHFESWRQTKHETPTGIVEQRGMNARPATLTRGNVCYTLFAMECDACEQVNETHGHAAGDVLLKMVKARLHRVTRKEDSLAWLGGNMFALIAPGLLAAAGEAVASRLATAVSEDPYVLADGLAVRVGISVGYACAPKDGVSLHMLSERADAALCAIKRRCKGGRQTPAS